MTSSERAVTLAALVVLAVSVPLLLGVGAARDHQAAVSERNELSKQIPVRQAPADYDGDGITDATDRCPTRPETTNGFQDSDGCPDVVTTTGAS